MEEENDEVVDVENLSKHDLIKLLDNERKRSEYFQKLMKSEQQVKLNLIDKCDELKRRVSLLMFDEEEFIKWVIKNNYPKIDARDEKGSVLVDGDYEVNGHFMTTVNSISEYFELAKGSIRIPRTKEEIRQMRQFIDFFNDGKFMNQQYRRGLLDAFAFLEGYEDLVPLEKIQRLIQILKGIENDRTNT